MSNSPTPSDTPLTGADCMLRAFDREARRYHGASHASQLVLQLGPGLRDDALRSAFSDLVRSAPIVRASIHRRWGVGRPVYDMAAQGRGPVLRVHELDARADGAAAGEVCWRAMNESFDGRRGELLRGDLIRYRDGGADLALTWLHMLLDGTGSELFVSALAAVGAGAAENVTMSLGPESDADGLSFRERGDKARQWQAFLREFANTPTASPAGALRRGQQRTRYKLTTLSADETDRVVESAKAMAGFLTPVMYYMAAAIAAHHDLMRRRNTVPPSYVVPLPVNTRPRGEEGAIFRTHVSMLWFQVNSGIAENFEELLADLKRQRHEMIKAGLVDSGRCAIEFARYMPAGPFGRMVRGTLGGELCSFFFAFTGGFLDGIDSFFGAPIENGFHAPAVLPSPGSCAAMSIYEGRLNLTHVYQAEALSEPEVERFAESMREQLLR